MDINYYFHIMENIIQLNGCFDFDEDEDSLKGNQILVFNNNQIKLK